MAKHVSWPLLIVVFLLSSSSPGAEGNTERARDWTHVVRIGAYGLNSNNIDQIVRDATASHVYGIEVDNDITGRYESFLDPTHKLKEIQALAAKAHQAGNKAFVYIAGTECITANAANSAHSMAKDHPDWLQRKVTGEPAIFGSGAAFWIAPGDEDVWISPYAQEWRKQYMQRVRQIAATGIDGIYVDIPYWMTHFEGWEQTWASFDDYTVAAFRERTGLDARKDLKLGDLTDPNFRKWVDFRIETITGFMREIDESAKSVNPNIRTIPEIYPGIEEEAVRVGADVYELYPVVDAIAHEYEFGGGDHTASARSFADWMFYQVGMHAFRSFAQGKATWILNYSWDGDKKIAPQDAMLNLAMSEVMAGANMWDAKGHNMSNSNDIATRTRIFGWVAQHQDHFYQPRIPIDPVGVYFSPKTRDYFFSEFISSFRGVVTLLMQEHWEFQVVTPRTLREFHGHTLVLPDVQVLSDEELNELRQFTNQGGKIVATGKTALPQLGSAVKDFPDDPGKRHADALERDSEEKSPSSYSELLAALQHQPRIRVDVSPTVATSMAIVEGKPHVFFANFSGLVGGKNAVPVPQANGTIAVANTKATALHWLPFMQEEVQIKGKRVGNDMVFRLPNIERGAVAWFEVDGVRHD
ncbi:MAG: hypothetical protein LUO93_04780 [Methanomicrobiales archaeon]|nr:hypothetical protein [Methanomicrobiales archaeon]